MPTLNFKPFLTFLRDSLAGLGILYALQLGGFTNLTVQSMQISPEQAYAIQNNSSWGAGPEEVVKPKRGAK
jgi:hypothetical protein